MRDFCEYSAFSAERIDDNILHVNLRKVKKLTSEDVALMYKCFKECSPGGVYVIVTFSGYMPLSEEAMDEAKKPANQKHIKAMAYVIRSSALRIMAKFFMNFYRPNYKSGIFNTKSEALVWVKKIKSEASR
jgi:hypothetical protein